jgi:hypothetical protein
LKPTISTDSRRIEPRLYPLDLVQPAEGNTTRRGT